MGSSGRSEGVSTYEVQITFLYGYETPEDEDTELSATVDAANQKEAITKAVQLHYGRDAWFDPIEGEFIGQIFSRCSQKDMNYSETGMVRISVIKE